MTQADDLRRQIAKREAAISRLEAKAGRCNTASEIGRALATRAEGSAAYNRKLLLRLRERLQALGG
jgi:hypothetical protein